MESPAVAAVTSATDPRSVYAGKYRPSLGSTVIPAVGRDANGAEALIARAAPSCMPNFIRCLRDSLGELVGIVSIL